MLLFLLIKLSILCLCLSYRKVKMKRALCFKNLDSLVELTQGKRDSIDLEFVDRDICEKVEEGYLQVIPYAGIFTINSLTGDIHFATYRRPAKITEERLAGNSSLGFGGHIDQDEDIICSNVTTKEDGSKVYNMNLEELMKTSLKAGKRELLEELGFNPIEEFGIKDEELEMFFTHNEETEVDKVHVGLFIKINLDNQKFQQFFEKANAEKEEVERLGAICISVAKLLETFDVSEAFRQLKEKLIADLNMESWSNIYIGHVISPIIDMFRNNVTYSNMLEAMKTNVETKRKEAAEKAEAEAKAKEEATNPEVVTDVQVKESEVVAESQQPAVGDTEVEGAAI